MPIGIHDLVGGCGPDGDLAGQQQVVARGDVQHRGDEVARLPVGIVARGAQLDVARTHVVQVACPPLHADGAVERRVAVAYGRGDAADAGVGARRNAHRLVVEAQVGHGLVGRRDTRLLADAVAAPGEFAEVLRQQGKLLALGVEPGADDGRNGAEVLFRAGLVHSLHGEGHDALAGGGARQGYFDVTVAGRRDRIAAAGGRDPLAAGLRHRDGVFFRAERLDVGDAELGPGFRVEFEHTRDVELLSVVEGFPLEDTVVLPDGDGDVLFAAAVQVDGGVTLLGGVLVAGDRHLLVGAGVSLARELVDMHPAVGVRPLAAVGGVADLPVPRGADRERIARFDVRETHLAQVAFEEPLVVVAARGKTADPAQRENYRQFMNKFHHDWIVSLFVKPIKKIRNRLRIHCRMSISYTVSNDIE